MVKVNNLQQIKELHDSLLALNQEILSIENLANELVSDKCKLKLHIEVENTSKPKEKVEFDEDGSIVKPSRFDGIASITWSLINSYPLTTSQATPTHPKSQTTLSFSDSQCLSALDIILRLKQYERSATIQKLNKLGIEI